MIVVLQLLSGAMMDGQLQKEEKDALLDYRLKNLIGEDEHWQVRDPPSLYFIISTLQKAHGNAFT